MELMLLGLVLAVIGLALWWPRSERELAERDRALDEWRRWHEERPSADPPEGAEPSDVPSPSVRPGASPPS